MAARALTVVLILSGASLAFGAGEKPHERAAVPPPEEITKAERLVKDTYEDRYKKTKIADFSAFADELLKLAGEEADAAAAKYVLLREAREVAVRAGNSSIAFQAADQLAATFDLDLAKSHVVMAERLAGSVSSPTAARDAAESLIETARKARDVDDWEATATLLKAAETAARKSQSTSLMTRVLGERKRADAIKAEWEKVKDRVAVLEKTPDDPAANAAVGKFLCFVKRDWDKGLANLAKGDEGILKDAAVKDLTAADGSPAEALAAGDTWYDLAAKVDATVKTPMKLRSYTWYAKAVTGVEGLEKVKAEKRMAELQKVVDAANDRAAMWSLVRKAMTQKKLRRWDIVGGGFSRTEFEEVPKEGAILIGFHYTTVSNGQYPGLMQPIFLTPRGEIRGKLYGRVDKTVTKLEIVKAKPGYAVGAIYTRGGGGIDAFKLIFMRITDKGLNVDDRYDGPQIGGEGGGPGTFGGDGNFVIGIHGKINKDTKIEAVSLVSTTEFASGPPLGETKTRRKKP